MREVSARNASRNIPTCVGKTGAVEADGVTDEETSPPAWGKLQASSPVEDSVETSPPAWGKLKKKRRLRAMCRNIPTCVGKTHDEAHLSRKSGKHPHLRGENNGSAILHVNLLETSPPAWGKLTMRRPPGSISRNIPTCVGKTRRQACALPTFEKHPHLRGENQRRSFNRAAFLETSPPAWGKLARLQREDAKSRNIPTCVGKTR